VVVSIVTANKTNTCESLCNGDPFCVGYNFNGTDCNTIFLPNSTNSLAGVTQYKDGAMQYSSFY